MLPRLGFSSSAVRWKERWWLWFKLDPAFKINLLPSKSALAGRFTAVEMVSGWPIHIRQPCVWHTVLSPTQLLSDAHILDRQPFMSSFEKVKKSTKKQTEKAHSSLNYFEIKHCITLNYTNKQIHLNWGNEISGNGPQFPIFACG